MYSDVQTLQTHVKNQCSEGQKIKAEDSHNEERTSQMPHLDWTSDIGSSIYEDDATGDDYIEDVMEHFQPVA